MSTQQKHTPGPWEIHDGFSKTAQPAKPERVYVGAVEMVVVS